MTKDDLTQSQLKELLHYDPDTGVFTRINPKHPNRTFVGTKGSNLYIRIWVAGARYQAHQLAWLYVYGYRPSEVDHINHDRHDNRISNLRDVDRSGNMKNVQQRLGASGVTGVYPMPNGRYWAEIGDDGATKYLGSFDTLISASAAREAAEIEYGYSST